MPKKTLIVIAGPTASGKTALAIRLAQHYQTGILSADSRQFYREMSIGTAKPDAAELAAAPHYFVNSHSITQPFNVGDFEREALLLLDDLFKRHEVVIMAGGSGLYIKALCEGLDELPEVEPAIRERLNQRLAMEGLPALQAQLQEVDPDYYRQADIQNTQRVIRALEVAESTGQPFSSFRKAAFKPRPFQVVKLAIDLPREVLYARINHRVDIMMQAGLLDEVKRLLPYRHLNALNTVGYTELFAYLEGKMDLASAIALIQQNTRRFAKRQLTWFRREKKLHWIAPNDLKGLISWLDEQLKAL